MKCGFTGFPAVGSAYVGWKDFEGCIGFVGSVIRSCAMDCIGVGVTSGGRLVVGFHGTRVIFLGFLDLIRGWSRSVSTASLGSTAGVQGMLINVRRGAKMSKMGGRRSNYDVGIQRPDFRRIVREECTENTENNQFERK